MTAQQSIHELIIGANLASSIDEAENIIETVKQTFLQVGYTDTHALCYIQMCLLDAKNGGKRINNITELNYSNLPFTPKSRRERRRLERKGFKFQR